MLLKTDIALQALGRLGSTLSVINLDTDTGAHAKAIRKQFPTTLQTFLEKHQWNFANKFASLALVAEDPTSNWAFSYKLPDDCLVLRKIGNGGVFTDREEYEDEKQRWIQVYDPSNKLIYTNVGGAEGQYTVDVPDTSSFPTHFGRGLSALLALDIAPFIVTNNFSKIQSVLLANAMKELNEAIALDISMQPLALASDSPFARARL